MINGLKQKLLIALLTLVGSLASAQEANVDNNAKNSPEDWTIEKIECAGNEKTSCAILQNEVYLQPGDKVNEEEIENARLRLKTLGLFDEVDLSLQKGSARGQVVLLIRVRERSSYYANLGYSSYLEKSPSQINLNSGWTSLAIGNRNLFGLGKRLEVVGAAQVSDSKNNSLGVRYEDPNLFGSSKYFGHLRMNQYQSSFDGFHSTYQKTTIGVGRRIFDFSYLSFELDANHYEYGSDLPGNSYTAKFPWQYGQRVEYGWNTKDDLLFPTSGSQFATGLSVTEGYGSYYVNASTTRHIFGETYFNFASRLSMTQLDDHRYELLLSLEPEIAHYYTISRGPDRNPDRLKFYLNGDVAWYSNPAVIPIDVYRTGMTYWLDTFGSIDLSVSYMVNR